MNYEIEIKKRWFNKGYRWKVGTGNWGEWETLAKGKSPERYEAAQDAQQAARWVWAKTLPMNADRWHYKYDPEHDEIVKPE